MMGLERQSQEYRGYIEEYLRSWYDRFDSEPQKDLFDAIRYSLLSGGKRLRPIFVFEFCKMCGGDWKSAGPFAAAIEMIHTYSLIHDDLPCMDDDDYRRGRLTCHKVFGEALAVLAGDALLTDAFAVASTAKLPHSEQLPFAISVLAECAGSLGMVGGQVLDIESDHRVCTEEEVLAIQSRKTGRLINAACVLGVIAGGGSQEQLQNASAFAGLLGLAFQIRDDMLDVIGNAQELGKSVGVDNTKNTFVRLYGLKRCDDMVKDYTEKALKSLSLFSDTAFIQKLALQLTSRKT